MTLSGCSTVLSGKRDFDLIIFVRLSTYRIMRLAGRVDSWVN